METPQVVRVVWPAFLGACVLELLVFALVDPQQLQWLGQPLEVSRLGVYSLGFFAFWAVSMLISGITLLMAGQEAASPATD